MGRLGARTGGTTNRGNLHDRDVAPPWTKVRNGSGTVDPGRGPHAPAGSWPLSGVAHRTHCDGARLSLREWGGRGFLQHLRSIVLVALRVLGSLLLIADGARWIRSFFVETLAQIAQKT